MVMSRIADLQLDDAEALIAKVCPSCGLPNHRHESDCVRSRLRSVTWFNVQNYQFKYNFSDKTLFIYMPSQHIMMSRMRCSLRDYREIRKTISNMHDNARKKNPNYIDTHVDFSWYDDF